MENRDLSFVSAVEPGQTQLMEIVQPGDWQPLSVPIGQQVTVFQPQPMRDAGDEDRARAVLRLSIPTLALHGVLATAGTIGVFLTWEPGALALVLTWLLIMGLPGMATTLTLWGWTLMHSPGGVERLRLRKATELEKHRITKQTEAAVKMYRDYVGYLRGHDGRKN